VVEVQVVKSEEVEVEVSPVFLYPALALQAVLSRREAQGLLVRMPLEAQDGHTLAAPLQQALVASARKMFMRVAVAAASMEARLVRP